ncbi:MAG: competence/damage-inducible protein A [Flavobacteriales bacterium]
MNAEIISIGDELLIGQTINTNAAWLGEHLNLAGIRVQRTTTIGDSEQEIFQSLDESSSRVSLVLITGGLGPTKDDITKHTLCKYFDTKLEINEEALQRITGFFESRGLPMLQVNRDQAMLPASCTIIQNKRGTACGMWFQKGEVIYISMPGVPYEMTAMMEDEILPRLKAHFVQTDILHHTILIMGIGESFLAKKIEAWEEGLESDGIKLAYLPSPGMVKLRMSLYHMPDRPLAEQLFERRKAELYALVGEYIYGEGKETIQEIVGAMLRNEGATLCTAESCTGGYISHLITQVPGSSAYFKGSIVSYAEEIKISMLKLHSDTIEKYGLVSREVAEAMVVGVREEMATTWAIATTGIAGPDGGTEQNPVGTVWIAVAGPKGVVSEKFSLGRNRERTIHIASNYALNMLRKEILKTKA